jgi:hypothetical protein
MKEERKTQMVIDQTTRHLDRIKEKTEEMKKNIDQESTSVHEASLIDKLEFLGKMKIMDIEAQYSVEEWRMFSKHLLHSLQPFIKQHSKGYHSHLQSSWRNHQLTNKTFSFSILHLLNQNANY